MCYAKPGPRCTSHVKKELTALTKKVVELEDSGAPEREIKKARNALAAKFVEFDATLGGQKALEKQIAQGEKDGMDGRSLNSLKRRRDKGAITREAQTEAYKKTEKRRERFEYIKSQVEARQAQIAAGDPVNIGDMYPRDMTRAILEQGAVIQRNNGSWGGPATDYMRTAHLQECGVLATTDIDENHQWWTYDSLSEQMNSGICATVTCNCGEVLDEQLVGEDMKTSELILSMNKIR